METGVSLDGRCSIYMAENRWELAGGFSIYCQGQSGRCTYLIASYLNIRGPIILGNLAHVIYKHLF